MQISGIHHVTAIASDPQRNLDFFAHVLGLRLVKLTVNYDAPDTYHFYFGDASGHPGTILTFFPWPNAHLGTHGTGQADVLAFSIPPDSINYWINRLERHTVIPSKPFQRFDEEGIAFQDPDGLQVELIAEPEGFTSNVVPWQDSFVPVDVAIRGLHSVTLLEEGFEATMELLRDEFGYRQTYSSQDRFRFEAVSGAPGRKIDLISHPAAPVGRMGSGIIHHVAFRAADNAQQLAWREKLVARGMDVTPVIDRQYFHSIYFREPGGVLFEIATDQPGFAIDEEFDCLGTSLKLPEWLESRRSDITDMLPELKLPILCPETAL